MLSFVDAVGNPLPAGVQASFTAGASGPILGSQVLLAYTGVGGTIDPGSSLTASDEYTVTFFGTQAPADPITFTYSGTDQTLAASAYASPVASQTGYADQQAALWPRGWFSDTARTAGGIAYNLAIGLAAQLVDLSQQQQETFLAARLDTSVDTDIDSWVTDFFGDNLPRNSGETNAQYIARAKAMLRAKLSTPDGLTTLAGYFGIAWINEPWQVAQTGAWDQDGTCAWDTAGAWGDQEPLIQIYVEPNVGVVGSQMKSSLLAARGCGIDTEIVSVSPGASNQGWGVGKFDIAQFGVQSQNVGTLL